MKNVLIILIISIFSSIVAGEEIFSNAGSTGFAVLKIPEGAQQLAMGGTGVSYYNGVSSVYYNPALLASVSRIIGSFEHTEWFVGIKNDAIRFAVPLEKILKKEKKFGFIGLGLSALYVDGIEGREARPTSDPIYTFGYLDLISSLTYAISAGPEFDFGVSLKNIFESIDNSKASSYAIDVGGLYKIVKLNLSFGFSVSNFDFSLMGIGSKPDFNGEKFDLPLIYRLGTSWVGKFRSNNLIISLESIKPKDEFLWISFGFEWLMENGLALRTGYRFSKQDGNVTFGFGYNWKNFQLNYSTTSWVDNLNYIQRLGISYLY